MSDIDRLDERLRAADPARDADLDPTGPVATRLRLRVQQTSTSPLPPTRRRARKRIVAVVVTALLAVSGAAVASGWFDPDPEQVSTILEHARLGYDDGQLPTLLSTSTVWCAYQDGTVGSSAWHELAIDEEMTEQHLAAACTGGTDEVRVLGEPLPPIEDVTLCEASIPADELERRLDEIGEPIVEGDLAAPRPAFPFVLGWQADCAQTTLDTVPTVELQPLSSLAEMNRAREVEIRLQAAALTECLDDLDDVTLLASDARAELGDGWVVTDGTARMDLHGVACFGGVRVDALWGVLSIGGHGG